MKVSFSKLLDDKRFLMLFSLVVSAVSWMMIVSYISTIESNTVDNILVDFTFQQEQYLAPNNLSVITTEPVKVRVEVKADRKILNELKQKPENLHIYADLSGVPQKGTYEVPLLGDTPNLKNVQILAISPDSVQLRIDKQMTKTFTVTPEIIGLSVPDEYVAQGTTISPKTIEITGSEAEIQRIEKCVASTTFTQPLTKTETRSSEVKLYSNEGTLLSTESLIMDTNSVDISVRVYKQKQLDVRFQYTKYPVGFPLQKLGYTLSEDQVTVAGPDTTVDSLQYYDLGVVALNEIDKGTIFTFQVGEEGLPTGTTGINVPESITVSFDLEALESANFTIPNTNIFLKNVPTNYDVTLLTQSINNVRILGDKDVLETLTAQDLVAELDLSNREPSTGPYNLPVSISVPGKGLVWAVDGSNGPYMAVVTIKEKSTE